MQTMYNGIPFSPVTTTTNAVGQNDVSITVADASVLPPAPNLLTIWNDTQAETVVYTSITGNVVSGITRAIEGDKQAFTTGAFVARNMTALDLNTLQQNIKTLETNTTESLTTLDEEIETHTKNKDIHLELVEGKYKTSDGGEIVKSTDLDKKADLVSPTFTGQPLAPTPLKGASIKQVTNIEYNNLNYAPVGFGLGGAAQVVTGDWNSHIKTGFYMGTGLSNPPIVPTISGWYYVRSIQHDASHVFQQGWSLSSNRTCIRTLNGSWSAWEEISKISTGTWNIQFRGTIASGNPTFSVNECSYQLMGNLCFLQMRIVFSSLGGMSGGLRVRGLPFVPKAPVKFSIVSSNTNVNNKSMIFDFYGAGVNDAIVLFSDGATETEGLASNLKDNTTLYLQSFYMI